MIWVCLHCGIELERRKDGPPGCRCCCRNATSTNWFPLDGTPFPLGIRPIPTPSISNHLLATKEDTDVQATPSR